jgi:hypothetical protein
MEKITGGQLTQIYHIATQQECGLEKLQFLIQSGFLADFFAGNWQQVNRDEFRELAHLAPEDFGVKSETTSKRIKDIQHLLITARSYSRDIKRDEMVPYMCAKLCLRSIDMAREIINKLLDSKEKREFCGEIVKIVNEAAAEAAILFEKLEQEGKDQDSKHEDAKVAVLLLAEYAKGNGFQLDHWMVNTVSK